MRTAIVTGAGAGIGAAVAVALLDAGYHVALAGRREQTLADTAGDRENALVVPTDVAVEEQVGHLFDTVERTWGRLDLLVNNAGTNGRAAPVEDMSAQVWQHVIGTNLTGSFLCARAAFRVMKRQRPRGGRIINNGSLSAHVPRPNSVAYTASKHAVTGLTRVLSLEGRQHDIACGQIDIGNAETAMTARMADGVPQADGSIRPEPRMDVSAVTDAVLYMAGLPLSANVQFMTVMATTMPFIGRG
ncbi:SDR family oxidoreductase [Kutzneria sp. NPDC052558]|uniref:SDR family oxidoreductase n=1 Tax=Kutzneria sp. NPDC052558 TaxID=3364121 RepID=UPI0037CBC040